jgi:hypothetical protein
MVGRGAASGGALSAADAQLNSAQLAARISDLKARAALRAAQEAEDAALAAALQAEEDDHAAAAAAAAAPPPQLGALGDEASPLDFMSAMVRVLASMPTEDDAATTRHFVLPGGNGSVRVVFGAPAGDAGAPLAALMGLGLGGMLGGAGGRFGMPFGLAGGDGMSYEQLLALQERLGGAVPRGATAEQVAALPTRRFVPREGAQPAENTCSICLADFEAGDELRGLPCAHAFHCGCIDQWLKTSRQCPCCRHEIAQ